MTTPNRRRVAADEMRARLVAAAIAQLAEHGMRGVTHRRVEQRAGVSQGLVKHHFGSLDGLVAAVVDHMADVELDAVMQVTPDQQAQAAATGAVPVAVWEAARAAWTATTSRPDLVRARFELYLHAGRNPALQDALAQARERFLDAASASLPGADPRAAAHLVLATVTGMLLHHVSAPDPELEANAPAFMIAVGAAALALPRPPEQAG